ncbi:MAG TPA: DUF1638 domain-containing protein, partial [Candidatus Ozemobacteraceae bacterium]|nr:DUF1638 domain-containing protein [Candidatus Ozemobacteraceae bacterium]
MTPQVDGILVCEILRPEVVAALADSDYRDLRILSFPTYCQHRGNRTCKLDQHIRLALPQVGQLLVFAGTCHHPQEPQAALPPGVKVVSVNNCFQHFLPQPLLEKLLREGAYLVTPGWLAVWRKVLETWGFDQPLAREFFRESCRRVVLVDTLIDPLSEQKLSEFGSYIDRPVETVPVGLDFFRLRLRELLRGRPENRAEPPARSLAEIAVVFDILNDLVGVKDERQAVEAIFRFVQTISSPRFMAFMIVRDSREYAVHTSPELAPIDDDTRRQMVQCENDHVTTVEDGFLIKIHRGGERLGVLLVKGFASPRHKYEYLNLLLLVQPALALAVV